MQCPKCKTEPLKPTKLDNDLPVNGCEKCGGALITLLYYRDWAERTANDTAEVDDATPPEEITPEEIADSRAAMPCPKCKNLMLKFNVAGTANNKIDLCGSCDEAWIDGGEWQLLKSLKLSKNIPSVFTDAWQRKVREELAEEKRRQRFSRLIGDEAMPTVDEFKTWLKSHKKRAEILLYLSGD